MWRSRPARRSHPRQAESSRDAIGARGRQEKRLQGAGALSRLMAPSFKGPERFLRRVLGDLLGAAQVFT